MLNLVYSTVLALATPPARWWLRRHAVYGPLAQRFSPPVPSLVERPVWVQACSLGEVNTVRPLVEALQAQHPDVPVVVSTSTRSGHARAVELFGTDGVTWFPFDTKRSVKGFLEALRPQALVLVETELWPNVVYECRKRNIQVVMVNGRLSDRNVQRYQRLRWWYGPLVRAITVAGMQSEVHAERIGALGMPSDRVRRTGNLKFDAVRDHVPSRSRMRLRSALGLKKEGRVLVFASTRPGEEGLASACWATLREEYPDLTLIIAPRHVERAAEIQANFSEPIRRRSVGASGGDGGARVVLLDTTGELSEVLSLASVAVVGGSFYPGVNGHNPLEAAALGVPVIFGPYMGNFEEAARVLVARGGARQLSCPEDLYLALSELLGDAAGRRQMGTRARKAVLDNQGAVRSTIQLIDEVLASRH